METELPLHETFASLPPVWPEDLMPAIDAALATGGAKVVVLDDDPTGTQTVHDIPVLTVWEPDLIEKEMLADGPGFYILTNSRAFSKERACAISAEIGGILRQVSHRTGRKSIVISRSDSTLRGHFPDEVDAMAAIGGSFSGVPKDRSGLPAILLCPFFEAGGRLTLGDVHYVAEAGRLIPAGETMFARDAVFGYRSSNLREWVVEKSGGQIRLEAVTSISLEEIRKGGPQTVARRLHLPKGAVCVANAVAQRDLDVLVLGSLLAEAEGVELAYRTAASFAATRMGLSPKPLLSSERLMVPGNRGGLIVAGSHVKKTTEQLERLRESAGEALFPIELPAAAALDSTESVRVIEDASALINARLAEGCDVLLYTSRDLVRGAGAADDLTVGQRVSACLAEIVRRIERSPRFLVAKGGITSSDIATLGLEVRRAWVLGQALPGVPVWQLGEESRFPGLPYVVFPGNVGDVEALLDLYNKVSLHPAGQQEP